MINKMNLVIFIQSIIKTCLSDTENLQNETFFKLSKSRNLQVKGIINNNKKH